MEMVICGLSMEMEMAELMGHVDKCIGCVYFGDEYSSNFCTKYGVIVPDSMMGCNEWVVDYR